MSDLAISVKNLSVSYASVQALRDVIVDIPKGSIAAIVGPNGAGKSTFFKSLLNLENKTNGQISLLGQTEDLSSLIAQKVAYIPQASQVNWQFPATVFDIVLMGRYPHIKGFFKRPSQADKVLAQQALERLGLWELRNRQISALSGGQRQRVFIARALAQEAELYLMDEPLAGIDIQTEAIIMDLLKEFQDEGKTTVVVHHDLHSLERYFDYLIWLNQTVLASGSLSSTLTAENYQKTYRTSQSLSLFDTAMERG